MTQGRPLLTLQRETIRFYKHGNDMIDQPTAFNSSYLGVWPNVFHFVDRIGVENINNDSTWKILLHTL